MPTVSACTLYHSIVAKIAFCLWKYFALLARVEVSKEQSIDHNRQKHITAGNESMILNTTAIHTVVNLKMCCLSVSHILCFKTICARFYKISLIKCQ